MVLIAFVVVRLLRTPGAGVRDLFTNGNVLGVATIASTLIVVGLIALLIHLRGWSIREYLALNWPPVRLVWISVGGLVVLLIASDLTSYVLGRPIVPPFMVEVYETSWLPLLLFTLVVTAPIGEEVLVRGFLFKGIASSRWGPLTAIIVSGFGWAIMHGAQYDWYAVVSIAVLGIFMGFVRLQTASLLVTTLLHAIANAAATAEVIIQQDWLK
jgi:membrane protease YdiL (CAAX protease family)